jgi:alpha-tubulin suppressor-like RCC1 family protein
MVVAGDDHACAVRLDGSVWCWGSNARGELGRETATGRDPEPAPVQWSAGMGN